MSHQITPHSIYLDHAAATPLSDEARAAIDANLSVPYGNPSSLHAAGRHAYDTLSACRHTIATALDVDPTELIFTGSGTESDNLALLGLARAHRAHGTHVVVSAIEHKAILAAAHQLTCEGYEVTLLPVDHTGLVSPAMLSAALRPDTTVVSIMYANNEIGTVMPIQELVRACRLYNPKSEYPLVHTDACQAVGLLPIAPRALGVDALTVNSAKIYGPKGVGLLYLRADVAIDPILIGGDQEHGRRAGTENVALIAGFSVALKDAVLHTRTHHVHMCELSEYFIRELTHQVPTITFNGHPTERLPNNVHVSLPHIEGESLVLLLSEAGVYAATGSACSSNDLEPSHVLLAIGQDADLIHGSLRFTFGRHTTKDDLGYTVHTLKNAVHHLCRITSSTTTLSRQRLQAHTSPTL